MIESQIYNIAKKSFNVIRENKILAKIPEFVVNKTMHLIRQK